MPMTKAEFEQRLEALERLTQLYKPERTVHLIVTASSLCILLLATGMMVYRGEATTAELGLMFGSTIGYGYIYGRPTP